MTRRWWISLAIVGAAVTGCRDRAPRAAIWPTRAPSCAAPAAPPAGWRHTRSALVARVGDAGHVASDAVIRAGAPATLDGKFAYGPVSKDLEGEPVTVVVATPRCATAVVATAETDDDGRAQIALPPQPAGFHAYWFVVSGDGTTAAGGVWSLAGPTPAVVFDVDGTLTTDDGELVDDLLGRGAEVFPGAADVARRWSDLGYLVIYVTGRPYPLRARTRRWLDDHGFPFGPLFTPAHLRDGVPTTGGVGAYKLATLKALMASGVVIRRAYGNAATDVCAYAQAGIDPAATSIVGAATPCAGFAPPHPLVDYRAHLTELASLPPAR